MGATIEAIGDVKTFAGERTMPSSFRLKTMGWLSVPQGLCGMNFGDPLDQATGFKLKFVPCVEGDKDQILHSEHLLDGFQIRFGDSELCLDSASGDALLVYPCYEEASANDNQVWHSTDEGNLVWRRGDQPLYVSCPPEKKGKKKDAYSLSSCAPKGG